MARPRRKKEPSAFSGNGTGQPPARVLPDRCPLCHEFGGNDVQAHLYSHAPTASCQRCEVKEKGWRLDWDLVKHPRPDVSVFFCSGCGRYAPPAAAAPNTPHLEDSP